MAEEKKNFVRRLQRSGIVSKVPKARPVVRMSALHRSIRPEIKKFDDTTWSSETLDDYVSPSLSNLIQIGQGDLISNRQGNKIFLKYIMVRGWLVGSATAGVRTPVRISIVLDKQPNAANAAWADVYQSHANVNLNMNAQPNFGNSSRFKILKDKTFNIEYSTGGGSSLQMFKFKVPVNKYVTYVNQNAAVPATNNVLALGWSTLTANTPQVTMVARAYYTDA